MLVYAISRFRWLTNMHSWYGSRGIGGIHSAMRVKQVSAPSEKASCSLKVKAYILSSLQESPSASQARIGMQ